jgi:hypothetical protein
VKDYEDVLETCRVMGNTEFREFHMLYLQRDVYGLFDVVENFRSGCIEHCGLDPAHYIGLPSLAWDAMLKFTAVELELLEDRDMYLLCKQAKRGGYSGVCTLQYTVRNPPTEPVLTIGPKDTW